MSNTTQKTADELYWSNYYGSGVAPEEPSNFAKYVIDNHAKPADKIIELGCGNGRDARFFAASSLRVQAVDLCESEIEELAESNGASNLKYKSGDFTRLSDSEDKYDIIYSRFTLHSVDAEGQKRTLQWCKNNLAPSGKLCIEVRGQKNELYKKGEPVSGEDDAYIYENHYRRFINFDQFKNDLQTLGFEIIESAEKTGFAPFKDTDYHFIRVIAKTS